MPWWRVSIPHLSYISTYLPNLSTHPPTHPYTHPPTHLPIHSSTHPPIIHPSTYPPTHQPIHHPCIHLLSHPLIHPSTHPSIHPSIHPFIHPSIHPSVFPLAFLFLLSLFLICTVKVYRGLLWVGRYKDEHCPHPPGTNPTEGSVCPTLCKSLLVCPINLLYQELLSPSGPVVQDLAQSWTTYQCVD